MSPSPARAEAAVAVAQKWFPDFSSDKPVKPETIAWLTSLDAESVKRVLNQVHWRWSESDPQSMAAFLASHDSDQIPAHAYVTLARNMARKHPLEALEWTSHLPADHSLSAGSEAFSEWRRSQPGSARRWLNDLPLTDTRRQPFFENAVRMLVHDPQAAEELAAMTGADRAAARSVIETMSLSEDWRARLLEVLKSR